MSLVLTSVSSFLLSGLFLLLLKRISFRYNILVSQGIPLIGGISMGAAFFLTLLLSYGGWRNLPGETAGILIGAGIMLGFGFMDDRRELSVREKFFVQILAAAVLIAFGVRTRIIFLNEPMNILLSLLWIIGITNTINLLDVMDGLAGGVTFIILLGFSLISFWVGDVTILVVSSALAGAIFCFLFFNLPPAKVYMGNSGSHFLGFMLAAISLTTRYATLGQEVALLAPLLILGFPIFDTFFLIFIRIKKGKSAFNKSNDHLALRFLKIGHSKGRTLVRMLLWTAFFVFAGALLTKVPNFFAWVVVVLIGFSAVILGRKMGRVEV